MTEIEPVGIAEIAQRAGVQQITVRKWIERHPGFPDPRWTVSGNGAWEWVEVRDWLVSTDRRLEVARADLIAAGWTIDRLRGTGQWDGCIFISREDPGDDDGRMRLIVAPTADEHAYGWIMTEFAGGSWSSSVSRYGANDVVAVADLMACVIRDGH